MTHVSTSFLFKDKKNQNEKVVVASTMKTNRWTHFYIWNRPLHSCGNVCQLFLLTEMSSRKMFKNGKNFLLLVVHSSHFISPKRKVNPCDLWARIPREFRSPFPSHSGHNNKQWTRIFIAIFCLPVDNSIQFGNNSKMFQLSFIDDLDPNR